tara:strand:+ start:91 stop:321 length:231 start_codon:yes stop_codon:yes gene_type:complete
MREAVAGFIRDAGKSIFSIASRIRPNILVAMAIVGVLGLGIARIGLTMNNGELVSAAGVGAIVAVANLAGKILEKE